MITTTAALILGGLSAAGALGGAALSSKAAKTAAGQQTDAAGQALDFQKEMWGDQQANQAPFLQAGQSSIAQLMDAVKSGKFGPGSLGEVPQFTDIFKAPTAEEARATPGYQFTAQQGSKGILQGAAAAGGAISGGTMKALDSYNTGLADSTYNDTFNRSLTTYNAGLAKYGAQLQGFNAGMGAQNQEFGQLMQPAALGEGSVQSLNNTGSNMATNAGNLMTQVGNANAAGTVGSANAWNSGMSNAINGILQSYLISKMKPAGSGPG